MCIHIAGYRKKEIAKFTSQTSEPTLKEFFLNKQNQVNKLPE